MYHAHFGLERGLFGEGIAADQAVFRGPKHDQLIAHFKLAFGSPSSGAVLRGPAGVGKTTLTAAALRATGTRLALAWINGNAANAAELLELILVELGIGTLNTTRIERLQLWRQFQGEMRATDSRLFVVVERAEDLSPEVLHALDQLTAPDAAGNPGANFVLLGNEGIDSHLAVPLLESLRQRIRLRAELAPFNEADLQDYLRHQVACAGGHYDHVFAPGTVAALYRYSRGIARLANNLCEAALDVAAVQRQKLLTADLVAKTAVSLLGLAEPAPLIRAPVTAGSAVPAPAVRPVPEPLPAAAPPPAATAPPTPMPTPTAARIASAPVPEPVAAPATRPAAIAEPQPQPNPVEVEYDGEATDVTDVALIDFPVLTDAVEPPEPSGKPMAPTPARTAPAAVAAAAPRATAAAAPTSTVSPTALAPAPTSVVAPVHAPAPAPAAPSAPAASAPAPAATSTAPPAAPVPKPASRVETAYTAPRPPPKLAAPPTPAPLPLKAEAPAPPAPPVPAPAVAAKPTAPLRTAPPPAEPEEDQLRQTQTLRAIAGAKSIDDLSEVDAETLFSDAELDLVAAALASAAEWPDDDEQPSQAPASAPTPAPQPPKAQPAKAAPVEAEDPFAFLGLGNDAPLELIDDSAPAPKDQARKTASR